MRAGAGAATPRGDEGGVAAAARARAPGTHCAGSGVAFGQRQLATATAARGCGTRGGWARLFDHKRKIRRHFLRGRTDTVVPCLRLLLLFGLLPLLFLPPVCNATGGDRCQLPRTQLRRAALAGRRRPTPRANASPPAIARWQPRGEAGGGSAPCGAVCGVTASDCGACCKRSVPRTSAHPISPASGGEEEHGEAPFHAMEGCQSQAPPPPPPTRFLLDLEVACTSRRAGDSSRCYSRRCGPGSRRVVAATARPSGRSLQLGGRYPVRLGKQHAANCAGSLASQAGRALAPLPGGANELPRSSGAQRSPHLHLGGWAPAVYAYGTGGSEVSQVAPSVCPLHA